MKWFQKACLLVAAIGILNVAAASGSKSPDGSDSDRVAEPAPQPDPAPVPPQPVPPPTPTPAPNPFALWNEAASQWSRSTVPTLDALKKLVNGNFYSCVYVVLSRMANYESNIDAYRSSGFYPQVRNEVIDGVVTEIVSLAEFSQAQYHFAEIKDLSRRADIAPSPKAAYQYTMKRGPYRSLMNEQFGADVSGNIYVYAKQTEAQNGELEWHYRCTKQN